MKPSNSFDAIIREEDDYKERREKLLWSIDKLSDDQLFACPMNIIGVRCIAYEPRRALSAALGGTLIYGRLAKRLWLLCRYSRVPHVDRVGSSGCQRGLSMQEHRRTATRRRRRNGLWLAGQVACACRSVWSDLSFKFVKARGTAIAVWRARQESAAPLQDK